VNVSKTAVFQVDFDSNNINKPLLFAYKQENPEIIGVSLLRELKNVSGHNLLKVPFLIEKSNHNRIVITLASSRIDKYLKIDKNELNRLLKIFAKQQYYDIKKFNINYMELATQYEFLIDSGAVSSKADLARYLGKSRAWITKVIQRGNPN